jgi:hypothetical protein
MHYRARSSRYAAVAVVVMVAAGVVVPSAAARFTGGPDSGGGTLPGMTRVDLAGALRSDGTLRDDARIVGAVDTSAWTMTTDIATGDAPHFAPAGAADGSVGPWSALGSDGAGNGALNNFVYAVAVSGTNVYVAGAFSNAAGIAEADYVARWNGSAWSALGSNGAGNGALVNASIRAIAVSGSSVFVGGYFNNAAGIATADYVAKWNGSAWSALGSNGAGNGALNSAVLALAVDGPNLYAGGLFTNAAAVATADYVAKWNGSAWSALGSNGAGDGALASADVRALAISGTSLYVGGDFSDVAGIATADSIVRWNGSAWSALGSNGAGDGAISAAYPSVSTVMAIGVAGADLYVGGIFSNAGGIEAADHIAKWNGSAWSALGSVHGQGALGPAVRTIAISGTDIYAGGDFSVAAGVRISRWNGSTWSPLAADGALGLVSSVNTVAVLTDDLYLGGTFTDAAGIPEADRVARYSLVPFTDIWGLTFEDDIIWLWQEGITSGCSATLYCPNAPVSRGQMASFLARALGLPASATDYFTDDEGSSHEADINRVAKAGITTGCAAGEYCPLANVSREQMASFLVRALDLVDGASVDYFTDDDSSTHEPNINRLRHAGLTTGCTATTFCPKANVTRGQMAAFLRRGFD